MRIAPIALVVGILVAAAPPALAGEGRDGDARERIVKGLVQGIEALQALGGQEEAVAHLKRVLAQVKEGAEVAHEQLECLRIARKVLGEAGKHDLADIAERSASPPGARAEALMVAAELLQARGEKKPAQRLAEQARRLRGEAGVRARDDGDEQRALTRRLELLAVAQHAAREADRADAAELLEHAMHSAKLMLAGRDDPEAQEIYARTPPLPMLARLVHQSAEFWAEHGHEGKAAALKELSAYYAELAQAQGGEQAAPGAAPRARIERVPSEREADVAAQLREMQAELDRLRKMLDELRAAAERAR